MQELSAVMRSIELYRISAESKFRKSFNDLTSSLEKRPKFASTQNLSSTSSTPKTRSNFKRNYHKKRNSADIERIFAKYGYSREQNSMSKTVPKSGSSKSVHNPNIDEIKCVTVKEKEIGTKYNTCNPTTTTNLTDSDKIALRPKSNQNRRDKGSTSQKFEKYQRRVKSVFIIGSEKELWKFKSSDNVSKVEVIDEELDEMINRVESHGNLFEKCSSSNSKNLNVSYGGGCSKRLKPLIEESDKYNTVPRKWESQHFCEESILTRPVSGVWEMPKSKTLFLINSNCNNTQNDYFYTKVKKGESCTSLNSTKKWWKSRFTGKKRVFDCWVKWRRRKVDNTDEKIQEIDDGFFEKFGSLLRQSSVKAAIAEATPLAPLIESPIAIPETVLEEPLAESQIKQPEASDGSPVQLSLRFSGDSDSGNETLLDTDSDSDEPTKHFLEQAVGWNIDELYKEVLYEIIHNVGCDGNLEIGQLSLLGYVQDAFKLSSERHRELLAEAEAKEPPDIMLNVEVIEAKDLQPKDANGLSDPFVTLFLLSNPTHRYNTSVKAETLSPVWEEHFSLPVAENPADDTLCVEVWDFDPAETVKEKMGKIFEVKGVKGFRKLMKEIAVTASTGKHDNELIGRASVPLKSIPTSGMTMWYSLDKKNKLKRQGVVKIRVAFSSEKNKQVAMQEHRHLLQVLLMHELENSKVAPYWWAGHYSAQAEALIQLHGALSGLDQNEKNLTQWTVFCAVHNEHPLSFTLFSNIISKLVKPLQANLIPGEEIKLFWDGVKKLLPSCLSVLRKIRKKTAGDKNVLKTLRDVLTILVTVADLNIPENIELFPPALYAWLQNKGDGFICDIRDVLKQACLQGATDWFINILDNNECNDKTEEGKLQHLIRVIQLVRSDLQRAMEYYDKIFAEVANLAYSKNLYMLYQSKISTLVERDVVEVCKSMKKLRYDELSPQKQMLACVNGDGTPAGCTNIENEPLAMGTTLFELYLVLQRFLILGQNLCPADWSLLEISKFHNWFYGGVAQWLDIAVYKALTRIEKAVELDGLVPVDNTVKYSSSAVDTLAIFYQIKVFWQQLAWPDVEGCYTFVAKIIDDICRCCVFYADNMSARVDGMGEVTTVYEKKFQVTTEWCLAINNIDYVRQSLQPFVAELGLVDIINKLGEVRSPAEAQRCEETLNNVIENAIDTVRNKIIELLERVVQKMMPSISRFLMEGAELLHRDCSSMDRVMLYLEENLDMLHEQLNQDNFTRTLDVIWEQLSQVLFHLVETNLEKRRPPAFFANLSECLKIMMQSFRQDNTESQPNETLSRVEYLLKLHGFETSDLIHQFFLERWEEQKKLNETPFGMLSVRAMFTESSLVIEVMNARNLLAMDSNGSVDSFVRIHLLPEDLFAGTIRPKTQTHNKNQFPLYDEKFTIILTPEQRKCLNGLVVFNVKDKDMFGMSNQYLAEAFVHFGEIPEDVEDLKVLPQVHLKLSRPTKLEGDAVKSLEHRQGDKQAREFLKKQKQKIGLPH